MSSIRCLLYSALLGVLPFSGISEAIVPGGLVANYHVASGTATEMRVTITVEIPPPDESTYFWAQQFATSQSVDHGGYFGVQTGGNINGQVVGKMFIFSIWNADQAEAGPGAVAQAFGGEGEGYSVRLAYQWSPNVPYTFHLAREDTQWWGLTVSAPGVSPVYIGRIHITQEAPLQTGFVAFTEYYTNLPSCDALPHVRVGFSNFTYGSTQIPAHSAFPYGNCVSNARGYLRGSTAVHEVGGMFEDGFETSGP